MCSLMTPAILDEEIKEFARDIYLVFNRNVTHSNAYLLRLIHKSDPNNRARLRQVFQVEVAVYEMWYNSPDEDAFFKKYLGDDYKERY